MSLLLFIAFVECMFFSGSTVYYFFLCTSLKPTLTGCTKNAIACIFVMRQQTQLVSLFKKRPPMHGRELQDFSDKLTISKATENDSADIWKWRNDANTRQMSIAADEVSWEAHNNWYNNSLINIDRYLYIGKIDEISKVGMCRFDVDATNNTAEVSINLNPDFRNKKISSLLLQKSIEVFIKEKRVDLTAIIKKENAASIKCFCSCKFVLDFADEEYNHYKLIIV